MFEIFVWVYRALFVCQRRTLDFFFAPEEVEPRYHVQVSALPWMSIEALTADNMRFTVTDEINEAIEYGDIVDREFLESATGITDSVAWYYLDSAELEMKEFPSEGILIENDGPAADAGDSHES
jgi:hypothetical protein